MYLFFTEFSNWLNIGRGRALQISVDVALERKEDDF